MPHMGSGGTSLGALHARYGLSYLPSSDILCFFILKRQPGFLGLDWVGLVVAMTTVM